MEQLMEVVMVNLSVQPRVTMWGLMTVQWTARLKEQLMVPMRVLLLVAVRETRMEQLMEVVMVPYSVHLMELYSVPLTGHLRVPNSVLLMAVEWVQYSVHLMGQQMVLMRALMKERMRGCSSVTLCHICNKWRWHTRSAILSVLGMHWLHC